MIRIAIVGTGGMAHAHANRFQSLKGCRLVAGVDILEENLNRYCDRFGIEHRFLSVADLIAWGEFDAAVVVTVDAAHVPCALPRHLPRAVRAGHASGDAGHRAGIPASRCAH